MEQDDPAVAAGDLLEPRLERLDLARRLGVDLAQERLAEVGQLGAGEAADEALAADDPELEPPDLVDGVPRWSTWMPASSSTAITSSQRLAWKSWLPSTA